MISDPKKHKNPKHHKNPLRNKNVPMKGLNEEHEREGKKRKRIAKNLLKQEKGKGGSIRNLEKLKREIKKMIYDENI